MNAQIEALKENSKLWDVYTSKEEYSPPKLDKHQRFLSSFSKNKEIFKPIVSQFMNEKGFSVEYPDNKNFAVCLTHDVDEIYPPRNHTILSSLTCIKGFDYKELNRQAFWKMHGKKRSPYWNFQEIMDLENKYGAQSSFFFLATASDIKRFRYNIEDLEDELGAIVDHGGEVGLHGGYYAYNDLDMILLEKLRLERVLGRKVIGYRNHYLRLKIPHTWEFLEKAGFNYDTTLGFPDRVGFRNGMCHPFWPYNLQTDREIKILEIPLVIMDGTLFDTGRSFQATFNLAKILIDSVAGNQGVLTLNWHSNNFNNPFRSSWPKIYEKILEYCHEKNAWITCGRDIYGWWSRWT